MKKDIYNWIIRQYERQRYDEENKDIYMCRSILKVMMLKDDDLITNGLILILALFINDSSIALCLTQVEKEKLKSELVKLV